MKNFLLSCVAISFLTPFVRADITQRLNIATQDMTTCQTYPYRMIFPNTACTDNGDGTVSINVSGGGGGGSSTLAVGTGTLSAFTNQVSSPTAIINFNGAEFTSNLTGASTNYVSIFAVPAADIGAGSLGSSVIASSVAVGTITNPNLVSGSFTNITGVGTLSIGTWSATRLLASEIPTDVAYLDVNQLWTAPQTYSSSETVTAGGGLGVNYNINVGSMTGAGLSSCSGASNAITWSSSNNLFGCNSGFLTANQTITLSGDVAGSGTTAITTTANATQANIRTFTSSETVTGGGGLGVTYGVIVGTFTDKSSTAHDIPVAEGNASPFVYISPGTAGQLLSSNGTSADPSFQAPASAPDVLYNSGGVLSGNVDFQYSGTSVTILGPLTISATEQANIIQLSSATTGIQLVSVSSTPAVASSDFSLLITSQTGTRVFGIQYDGHVVSSGTVPTVANNACGTTTQGVVNGNSTDFAGFVTAGTVTPSSCAVTFANAFANAPICIISDNLTTVTADVSAVSTTGFTVSLSAGSSGIIIYWICVGSKG